MAANVLSQPPTQRPAMNTCGTVLMPLRERSSDVSDVVFTRSASCIDTLRTSMGVPDEPTAYSDNPSDEEDEMVRGLMRYNARKDAEAAAAAAAQATAQAAVEAAAAAAAQAQEQE